jgi:DNA modification methylase
MVEVFDEVKRVLHPSGTVWCNVGDTMAGHHISGWRAGNEQKNGGHSNKNGVGTVPGIPAKNTLGLPWRLALALQAAGWWLRQDIVWAKKAPLPESVQDRCTKSHEYLFLLSKHPHYYFDQEAIKEPAQDWGLRDRTQSKNNTNGFAFAGQPPHRGLTNGNAAEAGRNKRSVWHLGPEPYAAGHFAVMPTKLVEPCILAGSSAYGVCSACGSPWRRVVERGRLVAAPGRSTSTPGAKGPSNPDNGWHETNWKPGHADGTTDRGFTPTCTCTAGVRRAVVLDPFGGSGTTALVAAQHGRDAILIDLNSRYLDLAIERLTLALAQLPLFGVGA